MLLINCIADYFFNKLNEVCNRVIAIGVPATLSRIFRNFPGIISANILSVIWSIFGLSDEDISRRKNVVMAKVQNGTVSIGFSAVAALIIMTLLQIW